MYQTFRRLVLLALLLQAPACAVDGDPTSEPVDLAATAGQVDRGPRLFLDAQGRLVAETDLEPGALTAPSAAEVRGQDSLLSGPYLLKNYHSGRCLEVPGRSRANGVWIDQWTCAASAQANLNQGWVQVWINSYSFRLLNSWTGGCMNVQGDSPANSAKIIQWTCGNYPNETFQQYRYSDTPAGYYYFAASTVGKVLNIAGASTINGGDLIQFTEVRSSNEYFKGI